MASRSRTSMDLRREVMKSTHTEWMSNEAHTLLLSSLEVKGAQRAIEVRRVLVSKNHSNEWCIKRTLKPVPIEKVEMETAGGRAWGFVTIFRAPLHTMIPEHVSSFPATVATNAEAQHAAVESKLGTPHSLPQATLSSKIYTPIVRLFARYKLRLAREKLDKLKESKSLDRPKNQPKWRRQSVERIRAFEGAKSPLANVQQPGSRVLRLKRTAEEASITNVHQPCSKALRLTRTSLEMITTSPVANEQQTRCKVIRLTRSSRENISKSLVVNVQNTSRKVIRSTTISTAEILESPLVNVQQPGRKALRLVRRSTEKVSESCGKATDAAVILQLPARLVLRLKKAPEEEF